MPPTAAMTGSAAACAVDSSPTTSSRLISSPTRKKKIAIRPSLIQWSSDLSSTSGATPRGTCVSSSARRGCRRVSSCRMRPSSAAASSTMPPAASCSKKALTPLTRAPFGFLLAIYCSPSLPVTPAPSATPARWPIKHWLRRAAIHPAHAGGDAGIDGGGGGAERYAGEAPLRRLPRYIAASRSPVPCGAEGRRRT